LDEILRKYNISPNQYFFLSAIYSRTNVYRIHQEEVEELIERSFILQDDSGIYLTQKSEQIFSTKEEAQKLFNNIWGIYPKKTPNGRLLRPLSVDSQIGRAAFRKLKKHLTNFKTYKEILNALKSEINIRNRNRSLNYMQHINTWINQQGWETYIDENDTEEDGSVFDMG
jgi:superfamily II RNA helicase